MKKNQPPINDEILAKYLAGEAAAKEVLEVEEWLKADANNKKELARLKVFVNDNPKDTYDTSNALEKVWNRIEKEDKGKVVEMKPPRQNNWLRIAAGMALLIGLSVFFLTRSADNLDNGIAMSTYESKEKSMTYQLPDGSKVTLNQHSTLQYPDQFDGNTREVVLEGEAFFDVTKNPTQPFIIKAGAGTITVLGTSFNVNTSDQQTSVFVKTGKVSLKSSEKSEEEVILTPGEKGTLKEGKASKETATAPNDLGWMTKQLEYANQPLHEVIEDLENMHGAKIELSNPAIANCMLTIAFDNNSLAEALEMIAFVLDVEIKGSAPNFTIDGKGC